MSKWWRINHLYKIKTKKGELVTFKPNTMQLKHMAERGSHKRNLILKARQFGVTTLYCIELLDDALWNTGTSCGITAHDRESLLKIFEIVRRAYVNLPDELKPQTKTDTKNALQFTQRFDGVPLDSSIAVAMGFRSGTLQNLHITESAYIKDRQEIVAGSKQTVPIGGRISEETTGNGYEDFYDFYTEADAHQDKLTELDYKTYFYPWFANPEYTLQGLIEDKTQEEHRLQHTHSLTDGQLLWRRWKMRELRVSQTGVGLTDQQLFKQEYPANKLEAFQSGAGNVFSLEKLDQQTATPPLPIEAMQTDEQKALHKLGVWFWRLPEAGREYVIGVDPSDGVGADYSPIDVVDKETLEQVAQFYGKVRPDELAEITRQIAEVYNRAFVGVENNMLTCIMFLSKIYDNYYFETKYDEKTQSQTRKIGFNTNTKTRDPLIDDLVRLHEEGLMTIHSAVTLQEMKTFVRKDNGKREHANGKHDDTLFSLGIALQIRNYRRPIAKAHTIKPSGW
jgi:hypothetical protein